MLTSKQKNHLTFDVFRSHEEVVNHIKAKVGELLTEVIKTIYCANGASADHAVSADWFAFYWGDCSRLLGVIPVESCVSESCVS